MSSVLSSGRVPFGRGVLEREEVGMCCAQSTDVTVLLFALLMDTLTEVRKEWKDGDHDVSECVGLDA